MDQYDQPVIDALATNQASDWTIPYHVVCVLDSRKEAALTEWQKRGLPVSGIERVPFPFAGLEEKCGLPLASLE